MDHKENIEILFQKLLLNECSPDEAEEIVKLLSKGSDRKVEELVLKQLQEPVSPGEISGDMHDNLEAVLDKILHSKNFGKSSEIPIRTLKGRSRFYRASLKYAVAIFFLFIASTAVYFVKDTLDPVSHVQKNSYPITVAHDFLPGGNKAVLLTAEGNTVYIDEGSGSNYIYKGVAHIKPEEGTIEYNTIENPPGKDLGSEQISYNTLFTPRGGQYQITLSDGSKVWLNAASSLKFPVAFKDTERVVELSGEAYFEVAKNADKPFKVKVNEVTVNVLGTHFNVNSYYENAEIKTTLLEGSVAISTTTQNVYLKPGQQVSHHGHKFENVLSGINLEQVIAWKNENFDFTNENLKNISKQLSRWYQVEIFIQDDFSNKNISGIISRKNNISKVLEVLEISAGISSRIEGDKVYLFKK